MSDDAESSGSEMEVTMFRCKYCPDTEFTAAERDLHRQQHREQRRRSGRESSPATTMFTQVPQDRAASDSGSPPPQRRGQKTGKKRPGPKSETMGPPQKKKKERKIRSVKKYENVVATNNDGG